MPVEASIDFPQADVNKLFAQMRRAEKELGKSMGQSVRFAGWAVAGALGAKTRVAKKHRPYRKVRGTKESKTFRITSHRTGSANKYFTNAPSVRELKTMPQVTITNAGLAKSAWFWGLKKIGGGRNIGMKGVTPQAKNRARRHVQTQSDFRSNNPFVKISNKLNYALDALVGRERAVAEAMGKAASRMEKIIDDNIKKKMGAK